MAKTKLVYSTDQGRLCPECSSPVAQCRCSAESVVSYTDGIVRLMLDRKGRKGKGVTLIEGTGLEGKALKDLAKKLKAKCATGGAIKNGVIEIQGDHRDTLEPLLIAAGFKVKRSGG